MRRIFLFLLVFLVVFSLKAQQVDTSINEVAVAADSAVLNLEECVEVYQSYINGTRPIEQTACWTAVDQDLVNSIKIFKNQLANYTAEPNEGREKFIAAHATFLASLPTEIRDDFPMELYMQETTPSDKKWQYISTVLGFLLALSLVMLFLKMKDNYTAAQKQNHTTKMEEHTPNAATEEVNELKKQLEELETEVDDLIEKNKLLRAENKELKSLLEQFQQTPPPTVPTSTVTEPSTPTYYAFSPDGTNGFTTKGLFQDAKENHIFIITLLNENTAEFEVTKEKEMQIHAAKTANTMLQPVCAFENLPREMQTGIETVEKGQLKLQGKEWMVQKEARIRFV